MEKKKLRDEVSAIELPPRITRELFQSVENQKVLQKLREDDKKAAKVRLDILLRQLQKK